MSTILIEEDSDDQRSGRDLAATYAALQQTAALNQKALEPMLNAISETARLQNAAWITQLAAINVSPIIAQAHVAALSAAVAAATLPRFTMPQIPGLQSAMQSLSASVTAAHSASYSELAATLTAAIPMPDLSGIQALIGSLQTDKWQEWLRHIHRPANWTDAIEDRINGVIDIVDGEGIPVAWVPRAAILEALLNAPSADERSLILIERRNEIIDDCEAVLSRVEEGADAPTLPIAQKVLAGFREGHWEIAAISAVAVIHGIVEALRWPSDHQKAPRHHALRPTDGPARLMEQATRAPLVRFYDDWNEKSGKPRPSHVTRHVVSHNLGPDQVSERNCVVSIMLMCSLLRTVYELELGSEESAA
ncbi:hypothetical protein [Microbacterium sp.]|uniref:hypothetical protein n=1 Tax=Microbacterium sp. TaxID=51671 RepID=UPI003F7081C5